MFIPSRTTPDLNHQNTCLCHDGPGSHDPVQCDSTGGDECEECSKLAFLNDKISKIREDLKALIKRRHEQYQAVNRRHDIFMRKLPVELRSKVFALACETSEFRNRTIRDLSLVSTSWRLTITTTPEIWTVISINLDYSHCLAELNDAGQSEIYKLLSRSGDLPLSIVLINTLTLVEFRVLDALKSQSHRFVNLKFHRVFHTTVVYLLFNCFSPSLRTISVFKDPVDSRKPIFTSDPNTDSRTPFSVALYGYDPSVLPISWRDVADFVGEFTPDAEVLKVIHRSPRLQRLHISNLVGADGAAQRQDIITHDNLRLLKLSLSSAVEPLRTFFFFSNLMLPSLSKLVIDVPANISPARISLECIGNLIQRSGCTLSSLVLRRCRKGLKDINLRSLLDLMSGLENLAIIDDAYIFIDDFFADLWETRNQHSGLQTLFLPGLSFEGQATKWIHEDDILELFPPENPDPGVHYRPLLKFITHGLEIGNAESESNIAQKIEKLRDRGLELIIMTEYDGIYFDSEFGICSS